MIQEPTLRARDGESGSTLIEVLIATTILTVALVGLAQAFVLGVTHSAVSQNNLIAREKAREAVESVHTARDTRTITWAQIRNVADGGVFLDGAQPLHQAGADGLINTDDDPDALEVIGPGADGLLGTDDDQRGVGFQREIIIEDVAGSPALRRLTIVITYPVSGLRPPPFRLVTFVSSFS